MSVPTGTPWPMVKIRLAAAASATAAQSLIENAPARPPAMITSRPVIEWRSRLSLLPIGGGDMTRDQFARLLAKSVGAAAEEGKDLVQSSALFRMLMLVRHGVRPLRPAALVNLGTEKKLPRRCASGDTSRS